MIIKVIVGEVFLGVVDGLGEGLFEFTETFDPGGIIVEVDVDFPGLFEGGMGGHSIHEANEIEDDAGVERGLCLQVGQASESSFEEAVAVGIPVDGGGFFSAEVEGVV